MVSRAVPPRCDPLAMTLGALLSRDPEGGVPALFAERRVSYSFNTRVAIRQACDLLGLAPGDEILVPAYNCGSEVDPLLHAGLKVTLYPVDRNGTTDPKDVERLIGAKTRAIYVIHYFGFPQPAVGALRQLCDDHGLPMIEDCALSLLSDAPADGRLGDVAVYCFYKFFPTLAGGALVVNSDRIAGTGRFPTAPPWSYVGRPLLRATLDMIFGAHRISALRRRLKPIAVDETEAEPDALPDALPDMPKDYYFDPRLLDTRISRLARRALPSFSVVAAVASRRENYRHYLELLGPGTCAALFGTLPKGVCPHSMPVLTSRRDAVAKALQARGIPATPWWSGFNQRLNWDGQTGAKFLKDHVLSLPLHQSLGRAEIVHIVSVLDEVASR